MKQLIFAAVLVAFAGSASAGNLNTFVEPTDSGEAAAIGANNAAWILPLVALVAIAASGGGGGGGEEEEPPIKVCPGDPRCPT